MDGNKRKITLSVSPTLLLLAVLVLAGLFLFTRTGRKEKKGLTIDDTALIVTRIQTLGELTTACYYDEMVLTRSKPGVLSSSPLGPLTRDDHDHLVLIAKGTVRAGIDLRDMGPDDIRFSGDTVFVRLPAPQYLDVIVNPSDFEVFAESGKWTHEEVTALQGAARQRLLMEADHAALKTKAYEGAMEAVTDLLAASGYTYIRYDHIPSYIKLPHFGD
jgi:hypothetical protein